jgi:glutathione reductase (NADPH)
MVTAGSVAGVTSSAFSTMGEYDYDLFFLGAGSGGVRGSRMSAAKGAKVAVCETQMQHGAPGFTAMGGTCVNVGCVPKKLFVYGSHYSHDFAESAAYGWNLPKGDITFDWPTLRDNKNKEISRLNGIYLKMLGNAGVDIIEGHGTVVDPHTVQVGDKQYSCKNICVSVGGWPFMPNIPGIEHAISSNEAFYLEDFPKRVVVVGGGYIAVEFAGIFEGFGSDVTLMYRGDMFLRGFDGDIRRHLKDQLVEQGMNLEFNTNPKSITKQEDGTLVVETEDGRTFECDAVMYATGRVPKTEGLGLEGAGVEMTPNGTIVVDEYSKTTCDSIYAIGDVTDRMCLTPVALHEGMCLANHLFGPEGAKPTKPDFKLVPGAVFSNPNIGTVGLTEEEAIDEYGADNLVLFKEVFRPMKHTLSERTGQRCMMKLIVNKETDVVLGAHMCGPEAGEIMQGIGVAIKAGAKKADFDATIGIHPSTAEEFVTMRTPQAKSSL